MALTVFGTANGGSPGLEQPPFAAVAEALGHVRRQAVERGDPAHRAVRLPAAPRLVQVVEGLRTALYPNHLGLAGASISQLETSDAEIDEAVRSCLETSLKELRDQVVVELRPRRPQQDQVAREASALVAAFAEQLPRIRTLLDSDLEAAFNGDPAADSFDEVMACYPGVKAITYHRFAHALHGLGVPVIARIIADAAHSATSIDIHPGARIGERFFIDHGTGVVVGGTAIIGSGVRLYQAVTLGAKSFPTDSAGRLVKGQPRHPIVEDDVVIYAGATILGRVTIGRGSTIGGNIWLTESVPPGSTITQARARHEVFGEGGGGI